MKCSLCTALLIGCLAVGLTGCQTSEPTMAPLPNELPDRPALNSVPDEAHYVAVSPGMGGFTYPLLEGQPYYIVDVEADRVLNEGVADRDGDIELKDGVVTFAGRRLFESETEGGRRIALFVKRELQQE